MSLFNVGADAHARYRGRIHRRAIKSCKAASPDPGGEPLARAPKEVSAEPAIVLAEGAQRLSSSLLDGLQSLAAAPDGVETAPSGGAEQNAAEAAYHTLADFTKRMI